MPGISSCVPCGTFPQTTNIPGPDGVPGIDGTNGVAGFTITTAPMMVPATVGSSVTIAVTSSVWMVIGMIVIVGQGQGAVLTNPGPATFQVTAIPSTTSVTLRWLQYPGDVAGGSTISTGAVVAASGVQPSLDSASVYGSGTAYQLTNTAALLTLGTITPSFTLTKAGTWLIHARVRYDYNGATFAAVRTVTSKLRRTNNTAGDLTGSTSAWLTEIITTLSYTALIHELPPILYTTANNNDIIQLWGSVSVVPTAGSLDAVEAEIVAIRIA